jgi:sugar transferase (PEP-CTERM system associated)
MGAARLQIMLEFFWLFVAAMLIFGLQRRAGDFMANALLPACGFALLMVLLNLAFGLYQSKQRLSNRAYLLRVGLALALGASLAFAGSETMFPTFPLAHDFGLAILFSVVGLLLIRHSIVFPLLGRLAHHRVLVLGVGPEARTVETSLAASELPGLNLVGFYPLQAGDDVSVAPSHIIQGYRSLPEAVRQLEINEIVVAVRQQRGGVLPLRALLSCRLNGVRVSDVPRFFEQVHGQVPIESLKASWLIYGEGYRQGPLRRFVKRGFDLVFGTLLLMAASPIMLVAALVIRMESSGGVIYRQKRVGLDGEEFVVLKFRSMARDAEKNGQAVWAAADDPRITTFGRFIRRARIDELPQLINVLKGEMSLVGPRPERPEFVSQLTEQIPFYAVRHSCKPGLTGWAQVRFSYGASIEQAAKKLEYDLFYVKNQSLALDLQILLETVRVVLLGEGAR